jgi:hypothetical protein
VFRFLNIHNNNHDRKKKSMSINTAAERDMHYHCDRDIVRLGTDNEELKAKLAALNAEAPRADGRPRMTTAQRNRLWELCGSYNVAFREDDYRPQFDLPIGYVGGRLGGADGSVFVGVSPEGRVSA